jgi:hypothetical protein
VGLGNCQSSGAIDAERIYVINTEGNLLRFNRADHKYIDATPVVEVTKVNDKEVGKAVGLTCAGGRLYIVRDNGEITVRGVSDLKVQHTFKVPDARDVAVASDGTLWVLAGTRDPPLHCYWGDDAANHQRCWEADGDRFR